ncbi:DUF305 domain-containing protein [Tabrizicola sp. TH137]|uniref:CopM family metallochaperone n=1 Tax=Tabrizicola sp. TH137 TaxID=2067452 RepID=UPI000C7E79F0|nr:DUF305 domain-containing protein [Tabrizicola sp. TH137]PLL12388.1 DUF305 domain-containing protein [Tabrizicola sp. TH137]
MTRHFPLAALLALTLAAPLAAQTTDHSGHDMGSDHAAHGMGTDSPATTAFREANARMHSGMDIPFTGNADIDFIRGMIAHHQGAIDMARIVLDHGTDPEVKKLATEIIAAQEAEITWMQDWLAKNGG